MKGYRLKTISISILLWPLATVFLTTPASAHKRIYIHSDASEAYLAQRTPDKPESYYFFEGVYFGGYINDPGLGDVAFTEIARGMAPHLAKRDYWTAKNKDSCDLLLVVSWGTTNPGFHGDVSRSLFKDYFDGDYYDTIARGDYEASEFKWYGEQRNSKLLGFYPYIRRDKFTGISPFEEYELRSAMQSERYFIVVTAFDFQELLRNKQWKRVWSTRFNMRSAGVAFKKAHVALSKAGSPYYGKKLKDLGTERANFEPVITDVEIGEIEVLESIDAPKGEGILNALRVPDRSR